ncbi:MAG TPA: hypothetical protein VGN20_11520 [Mucilaginibacter sp.]|jgi:hypothetical protein
MTRKIFKRSLLLLTLLAVQIGFAQDTNAAKQKSKADTESDFQQSINNLDINLKLGINHLVNNIVVKVNDIVPKMNVELSELKNLDFNIEPNIDFDVKSFTKSNDCTTQADGQQKQKFKSYGKSYPIDGNDKIKLSNQYGKIMVNTWDRPEIKVDVQIKAEADDDSFAQKLLDGVQIRDSKEGDLVSFRTTIEPNNNNSWKLWEWGGKKNHKLEINYTVYMPAKTDLTVEDSYGGIQLPTLDGKIKIRSSYGSVVAQNLSNPANEIEGSYGSLKVGVLNGAHLDYSYGSVDMDECNNLKANLSYGSFKLGRLKGAADMDLSYVGGFKIEEIVNSFKKLNVNSSYSGVSLGVPGGNNFDFDITTTYGGFNYSDDKVTITSKTPADGAKHIGPTRNYKGHFGKEGSDVQVTIHSTYGGVNFN